MRVSFSANARSLRDVELLRWRVKRTEIVVGWPSSYFTHRGMQVDPVGMTGISYRGRLVVRYLLQCTVICRANLIDYSILANYSTASFYFAPFNQAKSR